MRAVIDAHPRMVGILSEALASGKIIEGHARGLTGAALQAYLAAGVSADHEITSGADALEKLRAGLTVEIRGSHDYLLPDVVAAINTLPVVPTSLTICTDDVFPDDLVARGGVVDVLRRLIRYGLDPMQAIRCATINSAIRLRREDLGQIAAGRRADLVTLADLREVVVDRVYANGRHVATGGQMLEALEPSSPPPAADTMQIAPLTRDDFRVRVPGVRDGRVRVRTIKGARFNSWSERRRRSPRRLRRAAGRRQCDDRHPSPRPLERGPADSDHRRLGSLGRRLRQHLFARFPQSRGVRSRRGRDAAGRQHRDRDGRRHRGGEGRQL